MLRRAAITLLLALGLVAPAAASAKPAAATVGVPVVGKVRIVDVPADATLPHAGRVIVRVVVRHPALDRPAADVRTVGTTTVVVTRFTGDRNYAIGGGTAARALPVVDGTLAVVYQVVLSPEQSAKARAAARQGVLHVVVSVDQRAAAKGRAPASTGAFDQRDITLGAALPTETSATPPLLAKGSTIVAIDRSATGDAVAIVVDLPLSGGRRLRLDTGGTRRNGLVPFGGGDGALLGTATITDATGAVVATGAIQPGWILLRVSPTGRQRGTLSLGAFTLGTVAVTPTTILLTPPPTAR